MSFFQKLKSNIEEEKQEDISPKRKRGRPRKHQLPEVAIEDTAEKKEPARLPKKEGQAEGELTIDVYETDGELIIQSPVAGVKPEDLDISIENDMLLIRGTRPAPEEEEDKKSILQECYWGAFSRRLVLPAEVDGRVKASLERGILTIRMPKTEKKRKKKIVVEEIEE